MPTLASITQTLSEFHQQESQYIKQETAIIKHMQSQEPQHTTHPQYHSFLLALEALTQLRSSIYLQYKYLQQVSHKTKKQKELDLEDTPPPITSSFSANNDADLQEKQAAYDALMSVPSHTPVLLSVESSVDTSSSSSISVQAPPLPSLSPHEFTPPPLDDEAQLVSEEPSKSDLHEHNFDIDPTPYHEVIMNSPPPFQTSPQIDELHEDVEHTLNFTSDINPLLETGVPPTDHWSDNEHEQPQIEESLFPWNESLESALPKENSDQDHFFPNSVGEAGTAIFSTENADPSMMKQFLKPEDHLHTPTESMQVGTANIDVSSLPPVPKELDDAFEETPPNIPVSDHDMSDSDLDQAPRAPRIPMYLEVHISTPYTKLTAKSRNINQGGLFLETEEYLKIGEEVELSFTLPQNNHDIHCLALVRWVRGIRDVSEDKPIGMGVSFLNLRRSDWKKIAIYLDERSNQLC